MAKRRRKAATRAKAKPRRAPAKPARLKTPASRAVEAALAGIAHDIRTPLTGMVALAELLAASDLGAREREWAEAIKSGAEHLALLSTLIVDAVRGDGAPLVLRQEPFAPRALADSVAQAMRARAGNKGLQAEIAIADDLPAFASGDALRLRAALENLADNAVKFTDKGAVVFKAGVGRGKRGKLNLTFTVADTGIGIAPAALKKLFRPFAQGSEEVSRRYGGAGLGLVFVKRIAKAMGGDLAVTTRPGKGTTFRLVVPVELAETPPPGDAQSARAGRALTILCAEDNPYGRVIMNTILRELGHRVDFVESGEAVVEAIERGGYDAVLMDVTLTGLDGIEATRRIRALPGGAGRMPIIGISGRGDAASGEAALAAGMDVYLTKPVSPRKLAEALIGVAKTID